MTSSRRILLGFALTMLGVVATVTVVSHGVAALPALVPLVLAGVAFLLLRGPVWCTATMYALLVASVVILYSVVSAPPLALFLAGALALWREPRRTLVVILGAGAVTHVVVQLALGQDTVLTAVATLVGVAFFVAVGALAISQQRQRQRADELLEELETSRRAERAAYVVAERGRFARELHDVLAHTLSGLSLQLESARLLAQREGVPDALRESIDAAHKSARAGLVEARRAVAALRDGDAPGVDDLSALVEEHRLVTAAAIRLTEVGDRRAVDRDVGLALYRTAQEALTNVRKHAGGATVDMTVTWLPEHVELVVSDGGGRAPAPAEPGFGLVGMAERATALGGTVSAGPGDEGFEVRLMLPTGD